MAQTPKKVLKEPHLTEPRVHPGSSKVGGLCWNPTPKSGTMQVSVSMSGSQESEHQAFHPALNYTLFQHVFPSAKSEDKWKHAAMPIDKVPGTLFDS